MCYTSAALYTPSKSVSSHLYGLKPSLLTGVDSIGRVESFFDAISYQKGGSVIRMMRAYLNNRRIRQEQYGLRRSLLQVCFPFVHTAGSFVSRLCANACECLQAST